MTSLLDLFDELCDLEPERREARLAELASDDAALAARLRTMLSADASDSPLLARDVSDQSAVSMPEIRARDRSGNRFGPYVVLRELGSGGMGSVWLAERTLGGSVQQVALKFMRIPFDARLTRLFNTERDALARLEHPGIARLIDAGVTPEDEPFLATEFVDGEPLLQYVRSRRLDLDARLRLIEQLCEAADYAHRRLLVHRDIKPSNVLVDATGRPRLLDFGIVKSIDDARGEQTVDNPLSPAYAAPEQALGESISTATDVFALGLLLYELLTATLPGSRRSGGAGVLVQRIINETIELPSQCSVDTAAAVDPLLATRDWQRRLRGDLDQIVLTALRREPERRYPGALALAEDLRRFRDGHPVRARPDAVGYRLGKFARRHRGAVTAAAIAVLSLVLGLVAALWQAERAHRSAQLAAAEARRAEQQTEIARETVQRVQRVKEFMMVIFSAADPIRGAGESPTLEQAFAAAIERAHGTLDDDPKLRIDLLDDFGEIRANQGRFAEARALLEPALAQAEQLYGPDHPVVAETLRNLAATKNYEGDATAAALLVERALTIMRRHEDSHPLLLAAVLASSSGLKGMQGRPEEALAGFREALALQEAHGADPIQRAGSQHGIGTMLLELKRFDEAEGPLRASLELIAAATSSDGAAQLVTLSSLAMVLDQQGRQAEVTATLERAVQIARKAFPGAHSWTASAITDLGWDRVANGNVEAGIAELEAARLMYEELGSAEIVAVWRFLAIAHRRAGDNAKSIQAFDAAVQVCAEPGKDQPLCMVVSANRAMLRADLASKASPVSRSDAEAALSDAEAVLLRMRDRGWIDTTEAAQAKEAAATALMALGRRDDALARQREAVAIYISVYGDDHSETLRVKANLEKIDRATR